MLSVVCQTWKVLDVSVAEIDNWQLPINFRNCYMPTIKYQIIGVKSFMLDVKCFTEIAQQSSFKTVDKSISLCSPTESHIQIEGKKNLEFDVWQIYSLLCIDVR